MTLSARLLLVFVALTGLLVLPTGYATVRLAELQSLAVSERGSHAEASRALGRLEGSLSRLNLYLRSYLVTGDEEGEVQVASAMEELAAEERRLRDAGFPEAAEEVRPLIEALEASVDEVEGLAGQGDLARATLAFRGIQPLLGFTRERVGRAAGIVDARATEDFVRAEQISTSARTGTMAALFVALLAAGLMGVWATRIFTRPLRRLSYATADVADGRFRPPDDLPYEREDEIGDLSRSFRSMTRRLAELDRMKAEFVGVASHELKTPINVIMGYAELIDDELAGQVSEQQHEILKAIAEQCSAMTRLVSRLMDISRLEAGGYELQPESVHVQDLLTGLRRSHELLADRKGVRLSTRMSDSAPRTVVVDVDIFRDEILGNLVSNALKFTPEGGEVRVTVFSPPDEDVVVFRVADTGPGVPEEHRGHIFDRYYQVDRARKVGSGLGLAIVKNMAEAHGGSVSLECREDSGAVFHVRLPLHSAPVTPRDGSGPWKRAGSRERARTE